MKKINLMQVRDNNRYGPLSEDAVQSFESRHGFAIPEDYRSFLLAHHGGVPEPNFYWVVPGAWGSGICNLYGFGQDGYTLEEYYNGRSVFGLPDELLPIGDDGCSNFICIGVRGQQYGAIFYVDHEYATVEPDRVRQLAESFSEFIHNLSEDPDY